MTNSVSEPGANRRRKALIIALSLLVVAYLALIPWRRQIQRNTDRINRETAAAQARDAQNHAAAAAAADQQQIAQNSLNFARAAVRKSPNDPIAHLRLAAVLQTLGRFPQAEDEAKTMLRLRPGDKFGMVMLGQVQQHSKQYQAALDTFHSVLKRYPHETDALVSLGLMYITFGWSSQAIALLQGAVAAAPHDVQLRVEFALAYTQANDFRHAEQQLLEVRNLAPQQSKLWSPLIAVYNSTRRYKDAIAIGKQVLALDANDVRVMLPVGQAYFESGDNASAIAVFQKALTIDPTNVSAHYRLALCYQRDRQEGKARKELEYVLKKAPDFEQTRLLLGQIYIRQGLVSRASVLLTEYQKAQTAAEKYNRLSFLMATRPNDPNSHYQMAELYLSQHDTPHAIVELHRTLELDPAYAAARRLLARTEDGGRRTEDRT
ncbi:MAG TPA: tetratricopeptide repeat protein [Armatimonadota bacterium]|nr:tetratricopeptide repeat protein [Armatimonadota bacterium]